MNVIITERPKPLDIVFSSAEGDILCHTLEAAVELAVKRAAERGMRQRVARTRARHDRVLAPTVRFKVQDIR